MNRREFIVGGSVITFGTPGCLGNLAQTDPQSGAVFPSIQTEVVSEGRNGGLAFNSKVSKQFSSERPARIRLSLTNENSKPRTISFGSSPPFSSYWSENEEKSGQLVLVPDYRKYVRTETDDESGGSTLVPPNPHNDCWRLKNKLLRLDISLERTIGAGETISGLYTVLSNIGTEGCLIEGKYEFTTFEHDYTLSIILT